VTATRVRRDDPPGQPEHHLEPPVPVLVTSDGEQWPGFASRWRGRWVLCTWTRGPGLRHLGWVLGEDLVRL
jgi:hypothetical protein